MPVNDRLAAALVTIYRDRFGLPSIAAESPLDAGYGLGYAMALDNAVTMARNYKQARGRLAEVDGRALLIEDAFIQALGMEAAAEKHADELSGEQAALVRSFCSGANRALAEQRALLPEWIEPFKPADVLALAQLCNCLFPLADLTGQLNSGDGSNQIVVGAKRSAEGHSILSADPHLPWSGPLLWYEYSLYCSETNFHGVTLNGLPYGVMGHTDYVAWCMTNNDPCLSCWFTVETSDKHPDQYNYHGEWRDFETVSLTLNYRENGEMKSLQQPIKRTAWGPVSPSQSHAAMLSPLCCWDMLEQSAQMARAKTAAQFRNALMLRGISMTNIVYADVHGNIGYQFNARIPRRDESFDWRKPVSGADPRTRWGELWTLDELPHVDNPQSGLLINANSTPSSTPQSQELEANVWPNYVTSHGPTTRYERLAELLTADGAATIASVISHATDTQVPYARDAIRVLLTTCSEEPGERFGEAIALLKSWNGRADIDADGCAIYLYWMQADANNSVLARKAHEGVLWTPDEAATAKTSLKRAADAMVAQYGKIDIAWGEIHVSNRGPKTVAVSGLGYFLQGDKMAAVTPNHGPMQNGIINCVGGSSFRMIAELDPSGVRSWSILPYGVSQNPSSPHYADQMDLFGRGEFKDTIFGLERIRKEAVSTESLVLD